MAHIRALFVALAACMISGAALAQDYTAGAIKVTNAWTREVPPASKVAGGYMTITNTGTEPDTLVGGSIAGAGGFEVRPGRVIPPAATIVLKPRSSHAKPLGSTCITLSASLRY